MRRLLPRFFRPAFPVVCLLLALPLGVKAEDAPAPPDPKDKLIVETILRIDNFDINSSPPAKAAWIRFLHSQRGSDQYFALIQRFRLQDMTRDVLAHGLAHPNETSGAQAAETLFALGQSELLLRLTTIKDTQKAVAAVTLVGHAAKGKSVEILLPIIATSEQALPVRTAAVSAIGRRIDGQQALLQLVTAGKLSEDLRFAAANVLLSSTDAKIQAEAAQHLELPATADSQPLPPVAKLVARRGNVEGGAKVFATTGTCAKCHKVRGEGKEVGPDLSEIGSKLSREAMYVSILDPSAAISHNFETYMAATLDGDIVTGLLVSDTDQAVTIKTVEAIDKTIAKEDIDIFKKQSVSLMPQGLQKLLTVDQLVDLVEYLTTLKKPAGS